VTRLRAWVPLAVLVALVLVAGVFLGSSEGGGPPLDPSNPKRLGTKGLVEVLRELGADVTVTRAPLDADFDTAVVFSDDLDQTNRRRAQQFVEDGGTLLLTDPTSPLNPFNPVGQTDVGFLTASLERDCNLPALRAVGRVEAPGSVVYEVGTGARGCFPRNDGYWLVVADIGRGTLVVTGGAGAFVNQRLDDADNAMLAVAVLAPRPGTRVAVVQPPPPGVGGESLYDLISPSVRLAFVELGVAFLLLALWRARRLGKPVLEPQPVDLPGSELVVAVGHLLQRAGAMAQTVDALRADVRRELSERLGLPRGLDAEQLASVVADRTGADADQVLTALTRPVHNDGDLVEVARLIEAVRTEVTRAQSLEPSSLTP
jgi:hypothetical protein